MSFVTKDIAKAFFELDISGNGPSIAGKTPKPRGRDRPVASPPPAINEAKGNNKFSFLNLPAEMRLRIYDELLVCRFNREYNPSWAVGNTNQEQIMVGLSRGVRHGTMGPGILRTCKQIYSEAISILYSQNVFKISEPEPMFRFITHIGFGNLKLIKTLNIWVPYMAELYPWLQLLLLLAEEASGLRNITIAWGTDFDEWGQRGLGDNLEFVRALGKIQRLEKLVIKGYYAKNWPAYLGEKMCVQVRAICGLWLDGDQTDQIIRDSNEEELQNFRKYQRGTESLVP